MSKSKSFCYLAIVLPMIVFMNCNEKVKSKASIEKTNETIEVYNFDNELELKEYQGLKLDETHPNLLNPEISACDLQEVIQSWTDLHHKIGNFISDKGFNWEVEDESIKVVHKFYFESNGQIKYYFFRVLNKSVAANKKDEFGKIIQEFAMVYKINIDKKYEFAQCGKTKYWNKP